MNEARGVRWVNWSRTAASSPLRVVAPRSTAELREAVTGALDRGERVRPVGAGYSSNGVAQAPGVQIDSRHMRGLRSIDHAAGVARFGAGTTVAEAAALLEAEGAFLVNPTGNPDVTLAGAVATGSHGSGLRFASLGAQMTEVELVDGTGRIRRIGGAHEAELWPAVRLGLGALGVMSEVTLRIVPSFRVRTVERRISVRDLLDEWPTRVRGADHLALRWRPFTDEFVMREGFRERGEAGDAPTPRRSGRVVAAREAFGARIASRLPRLVPLVNRAGLRLHAPVDRIESPVRALSFTPAFHVATMAYAFPFQRLPELFEGVERIAHGLRPLTAFSLRVRVAAADDAFLSNAYGREIVSIALSVPHGLDARRVFDPLEAYFLSEGGLPHWGGYHTVRAAEFAHVLPHFGDFLAARDRLDPHRVFGNGHLRRVLGA
ncbi:MAG: D-arabinono-1,4-lactone oxidase [Pseudoclavibacter sp.]|nr:D-arabinono-1,4-lactone oxidase [Pseudoclavibacter sp.]